MNFKLEWIDNKKWDRLIHNRSRFLELKDDPTFRKDFGTFLTVFSWGLAIMSSYAVVTAAFVGLGYTNLEELKELAFFPVIGVILLAAGTVLGHKMSKKWGLK